MFLVVRRKTAADRDAGFNYHMTTSPNPAALAALIASRQTVLSSSPSRCNASRTFPSCACISRPAFVPQITCHQLLERGAKLTVNDLLGHNGPAERILEPISPRESSHESNPSSCIRSSSSEAGAIRSAPAFIIGERTGSCGSGRT
jgi:hypothetical protein